MNSSVLFALLFFFKQKTAYEMRIRDWSSDVCSSDLGDDEESRGGKIRRHRDVGRAQALAAAQAREARGVFDVDAERGQHAFGVVAGRVRLAHRGLALRSEEHTTELKSLMRISYAVFCLNKNINNTHTLLHHVTRRIMPFHLHNTRIQHNKLN